MKLMFCRLHIFMSSLFSISENNLGFYLCRAVRPHIEMCMRYLFAAYIRHRQRELNRKLNCENARLNQRFVRQ